MVFCSCYILLIKITDFFYRCNLLFLLHLCVVETGEADFFLADIEKSRTFAIG